MLWKALKRVAVGLFGNYRLNRIYTCDLEVPEETLPANWRLEQLTDLDAQLLGASPQLRARRSFAGPNALGWGIRVGTDLAATSWVWDRDRYRDTTWPLQAGEAMLVDILTDERFRGMGLATALIRRVTGELTRRGYRRVYCYIWRSNWPSIKAFERAGWRYVAFVVELYPLGRKRPVRLQFAGKHPAASPANPATSVDARTGF
jgi:ribosomal protein S18 acetylase RimI-like enzyme